jgi:hypothetical protein
MEEKLNEILKILKEQNEQLLVVLKALHLIPVSEEEEKQIQLRQRQSLRQSDKILEELDKMENIKQDVREEPFATKDEIFSDILGNDFRG